MRTGKTGAYGEELNLFAPVKWPCCIEGEIAGDELKEEEFEDVAMEAKTSFLATGRSTCSLIKRLILLGLPAVGCCEFNE